MIFSSDALSSVPFSAVPDNDLATTASIIIHVLDRGVAFTIDPRETTIGVTDLSLVFVVEFRETTVGVVDRSVTFTIDEREI